MRTEKVFYGTEALTHVFWLPSSSTEPHLKHKEQVTSNFVFLFCFVFLKSRQQLWRHKMNGF